jgi:hypothetical protein
MPEEVNTQASPQAPQPSAPAPERPEPPRILEREPEPEPKGLIDKLIRRIAV